MLKNLRSFLGTTIEARDGEIGIVSGFNINPNFWELRYFLVRTGFRDLHRTISISPSSLSLSDPDRPVLHADLFKEHLRGFPDIDATGVGSSPRSPSQLVDELLAGKMNVSDRSRRHGRVRDFIIDCTSWKILSAVIVLHDRASLLNGIRSLVSPANLDEPFATDPRFPVVIEREEEPLMESAEKIREKVTAGV